MSFHTLGDLHDHASGESQQLVVLVMKELAFELCLYMVEDTCCELSHCTIPSLVHFYHHSLFPLIPEIPYKSGQKYQRYSSEC